MIITGNDRSCFLHEHTLLNRAKPAGLPAFYSAQTWFLAHITACVVEKVFLCFGWVKPGPVGGSTEQRMSADPRAKSHTQ